MELVDRPAVQSSAADLADEVKSRSAADAAAKLASFSGLEIAAALMRLSPGFAQDVLGALPDEARERALNSGALAFVAKPIKTREVLDAARSVAGTPLQGALKVDGGMTANELLMQFQADVLGVPVIRPAVAETTALGAAFAAGLAVGFWAEEQELCERWHEDRRWEPQLEEEPREREYLQWRRAVERSLGWSQLTE